MKISFLSGRGRIFFICALMMAFALFSLVSCDEGGGFLGDGEDDGSSGNPFVDYWDSIIFDYYIDWGDGDAAHEYTVSADLDEASHNWLEGTPVTLPYHEFKGVYTKPNGAGEQIFGATGNLVSQNLVKNTIYYAYWSPVKLTIAFEIDEGDILEGYTFLNGTTVKHMTFLPGDSLSVAFPEVISDLPVLGWQADRHTAVAVGNTWNPAYQKVSDLPFEKAENNILTLTPVFQRYNCFLTLEWGNRKETVEVEYGDYIGDYLEYDTFAGMELVGWAKNPYETSEFVSDYDRIYEDETYYAVWRYYREVTLHNVTADEIGGVMYPAGSDAVGKHIYQYEPQFLPTPERQQYTFLGWYDNPQFEGEPVSRVLRYGDSTSDYYAKWMRTAYLIKVKYVQDYRTVTGNFVVQLSGDGYYRIDYSEIDCDEMGNANTVLLGLKLYGKLQFDSEGRWLGVGTIAESSSAVYEMAFADLFYYPEVSYTDPITGKNEYITLTAELDSDGYYRISDGDRLPSNAWATLSSYYVKEGGLYMKVFDADGTYMLKDRYAADEYVKHFSLTAVYSMAEVEIRYQIPEGFLVKGETEYAEEYVTKSYYQYAVSIASPALVPMAPENGTFVCWYHEYTDGNGDTVISEGSVQFKILEHCADIRYDEEKQVWYIIVKAEISYAPAEGDGDVTDTEGGE